MIIISPRCVPVNLQPMGALRCLTGDDAGRKAWKGKHEQGEEGHVLLLQRIPDGERGPQEAGGRGVQAPRRRAGKEGREGEGREGARAGKGLEGPSKICRTAKAP